MSCLVRVHYKMWGFIPASVVVDVVDVVAVYDGFAWEDFLVCFNEWGYLLRLPFKKITHTSPYVPPPAKPMVPREAITERRADGWRYYE